MHVQVFSLVSFEAIFVSAKQFTGHFSLASFAIRVVQVRNIIYGSYGRREKNIGVGACLAGPVLAGPLFLAI